MMDLLSMLKMANIFSPGLGPAPYDPTNPTGFSGAKMFPPDNQQSFPVGSIGGSPNPQIDQSSQSGGLDLNAAIQSLLNPKDEQFQNYANMIQAMPRPEQYEPSKFRRVMAGIAGMGTGSPVGISNGAVLGYKSNIPEGLKVQQAINDEPYNKALSTWANQIEPTGKIAQMEQTRNSGNRATGIGILQREAADRRIAEKERSDKAAEEDRDLERARKTARDQAYIQGKEWAMSHPNYEGRTDKDGMLYYVNKQDPTDIKKTDIDTGKLGDLQKSDLNIKGKLEEIKARGSEAKDLEGVKQTNRATNIGTRNLNAKEMEGIRQGNRVSLQALRNSGKIGNSLSPSATATDRVNKAIEILNARPDLERYFVIGGNKKPTGQLAEPDNGDPTELDFIRGQMGAKDIQLGSDINPKLNVQPSSSTQSNRELSRPVEMPKFDKADIEAKKRKVGPGRVLVWSQEMGFGSIPLDQVKDLKPNTIVVK